MYTYSDVINCQLPLQNTTDSLLIFIVIRVLYKYVRITRNLVRSVFFCLRTIKFLKGGKKENIIILYLVRSIRFQCDKFILKRTA